MLTVGHHTCRKDGGRNVVLQQSPYLSDGSINGKTPFLGTGYYFWDFDLEMAKKWGITHYGDSYYIVEADLNLPDENLLDLAGNKLAMHHFLTLLDRFKTKGIPVDKWKIGKFVNFLKEFRKTDYQVFPYEIIRAADYSAKISKRYQYFFNNPVNYTNFSPRYIICFITIEDIFLQNKRICHES